MSPFLQAQLTTLIEGCRVLEAYLDNASRLYTEVQNVRQSLQTHASNHPPKGDVIGRDVASESLALDVVQAMSIAVETLAAVPPTQGLPLEPGQLPRLRDMLDRATVRVGSDARARTAERLKGIYVIVDPEATRGRPVTEVAARSLEGGARVVQLRDKLSDKGPMLDTARELQSVCDEHSALFVMNDHADLARAANADVLHVGQTDLPVGDARGILGTHQLIGNSNGSMDEVLRSHEDSVDYIAVGAIYATTTMGKSGRRALGPAMIERVKETVSQPIVAIGGINRSNITDVVKAGADSVCVVSAITFADDPKAATEELVHLYESAAN